MACMRPLWRQGKAGPVLLPRRMFRGSFSVSLRAGCGGSRGFPEKRRGKRRIALAIRASESYTVSGIYPVTLKAEPGEDREEDQAMLGIKTNRDKWRNLAARFAEHKVLSAVLLSFFLNLVLESLCRRSPLGGVRFLAGAPLQFLYGTGIILLTVSLAGLVRRRQFAVLLISILWIGLGIVECVIKGFRITPLTAVDFRIIFSVFSILHIYLNVFQIILIVFSVLAVLAGLVLAFRKLPKAPPVDYPRAGIGCIAAGLFVWGTTVLFSSTGLLPSQFENLGEAYDTYGFAYCFSTSLFDRGISEPDSYSPEEVDTVVDELEYTTAAPEPAAAHVKPNIVVVQLESFFDVHALRGVTYSENPIPVFSRLKQTCSTGFLTVPSIGAGTANSEFEVLSGMSLDYFGTGEYPYETVLQSNVCESVNYALKEEGYACHAIHNHTATFYDRDKVYANLGFDTFTSVEYMENVKRNPLGWAEDGVLTGEVLRALDSTEGEDFVYTISVQAHGKYPTEVIDPGQTITADGLEDRIGTVGFEYYLNQLHATDAFVGDLIQALTAREEPTVLVLFGDHLPNFEIPQEMLQTGTLLQTEYVVWSNFGLEKQDQDLEAYQLMAEVMRRLGYTDGVLTKLHQERASNPSYQQDLEILEYDILYGKQYAYGGALPFEPTQLQMGVVPITVKRADNFHDEVYVTGQHFTAASRITVNGRVMDDTIYINANTLMLPAATLEDLDVVAVAQVTKEGELLTSSNQFTYVLS